MGGGGRDPNDPNPNSFPVRGLTIIPRTRVGYVAIVLTIIISSKCKWNNVLLNAKFILFIFLNVCKPNRI